MWNVVHPLEPFKEITVERERARQLADPNVDVCYLATMTAEGQPEVRAIALREIDPSQALLELNTRSNSRFLRATTRASGISSPHS
jgi:pyridoxine/pyridoxamine 5'-phosphate oxidase